MHSFVKLVAYLVEIRNVLRSTTPDERVADVRRMPPGWFGCGVVAWCLMIIAFVFHYK